MRHTWRLVVDIFEAGIGLEYPVVRHVFAGRTKEEAFGYFEAHLGTDEFLRDCESRGQWDGVTCSLRTRWVAPGRQIGED